MGKIEMSSFMEENYRVEDFYSSTLERIFSRLFRLSFSKIKNYKECISRVHDMILYGTSKYTEYKKEIIRYHFFDDPFDNGADAVFGIDVHLMKLVNFFKSTASGYGTEKKSITSSWAQWAQQSQYCTFTKKGTEHYSKTDDGAIYFQWVDEEETEILGGQKKFPSPMHEEPLKLIPREVRKKFLEEMNKGLEVDFKIKIKGQVCPADRHIFSGYMDQYDGDWGKVMKHVLVKRLILSEKDRLGIGTFQPKDEKNQDSTELTGDINYRKIAQYGSDSDPRAFNFDGEFNIANRGIVEFIEVLKLDVAFLYDLLGASQEQSIKPKKFAQTDIDEVILGHTNEPEFKELQNNEFMGTS